MGSRYLVDPDLLANLDALSAGGTAPVFSTPFPLDFYRDSDAVYYFPKLSELPPWDHIAFPTSYELSERCPIVTWEMNSSNLPGGNELT